MEFNPVDKLPELTKMLQAYNPIVHEKSDEGYDWLDEHSFCIELPNPCGGDSITIECACGEFTLCFSYYHSHYSAEDYYYSRMCEQLFNLLNNKCCSAALLYGSEKKWLSSTLIEKEKISQPVEDIFVFVFEHDTYVEKLTTNEGEVRFDFWDSSFSKTIKLPKYQL